jgi:hypothetical protein
MILFLLVSFSAEKIKEKKARNLSKQIKNHEEKYFLFSAKCFVDWKSFLKRKKKVALTTIKKRSIYQESFIEYH